MFARAAAFAGTLEEPYAPETREAAAVMALAEAAGDAVPRLAELLMRAGSAIALLEGRGSLAPSDRRIARLLSGRISQDVLEHWMAVVSDTLASSRGTSLFTITDPAYPANLRGVPRPPLFVFVKGTLLPDDERAVSVVGSRRTEERHERSAFDIAATLADAGVTVVSGLATGIDAAAHRGALAAAGRTIAAVATGVDRVYPPEHSRLSREVASSGALVSRSWPDAPPTRRGFRLRNEVTSGLSLATVVVDAGPTSGARLQARLAGEQRRRIVLLEHLVKREDWARRLACRAGVAVAAEPDSVIDALFDLLQAPRSTQLALF
jgi:DNA processing protein